MVLSEILSLEMRILHLQQQSLPVPVCQRKIGPQIYYEVEDGPGDTLYTVYTVINFHVERSSKEHHSSPFLCSICK